MKLFQCLYNLSVFSTILHAVQYTFCVQEHAAQYALCVPDRICVPVHAISPIFCVQEHVVQYTFCAQVHAVQYMYVRAVHQLLTLVLVVEDRHRTRLLRQGSTRWKQPGRGSQAT